MVVGDNIQGGVDLPIIRVTRRIGVAERAVAGAGSCIASIRN